jgi:hypothetical protein
MDAVRTSQNLHNEWLKIFFKITAYQSSSTKETKQGLNNLTQH